MPKKINAWDTPKMRKFHKECTKNAKDDVKESLSEFAIDWFNKGFIAGSNSAFDTLRNLIKRSKKNAKRNS